MAGSHSGGASSQKPPFAFLDVFVGSIRDVPLRSGMRDSRQPGMLPHIPAFPCISHHQTHITNLATSNAAREIGTSSNLNYTTCTMSGNI